MLKAFVIISAGILLAAAPVPAPGRVPQEAAAASGQSPVKATPESRARAKKLYGYDCAMCHGDNGNGKTDMAKDMQLTMLDYTDPRALTGKSDKELFDIIRAGKGKMPAEEADRAKNDDVWNLVLYIRGFSKGQAAASAAQ
jgi:mono/diheme cytochrome c family protein